MLSRALRAAGDAAIGGERAAARLRAVVVDTIGQTPGVDVEYAEVVDAATLRPLVHLDRDALVAVAAFVGSTRLIDNVNISVDGGTVTVDTGVVSPTFADPSARTQRAEVAVS